MKQTHFFLTFSSFIYFLVFSAFAGASTFKASIDHIDYATKTSESDLVMFSDGRVGVLPKTNKSSLYNAKSVLQLKETVKVKLDKKNRIVSITPLSEEEKEDNEREMEAIALEQKDFAEKRLRFDPSVVSMSQAKTMFGKMRRDYQKESQCYNRAHIWAFEENRRSGTNFMKVFVFYTRKYIRDYNFYWWFHAIPAVYVGSELITLDRRYARGPLSMKPWTDIFVRSRRACPVITKYSQYENNQQTEHCYLHYATQYFWQPRDLARLERTGYSKTKFITSEVNHAYWEAF